MNTDERLKILLDASPEQLAAIDGVLARRITETFSPAQGPLLLGMSASAKFLGVSRATLWRMINTVSLSICHEIPLTPPEATLSLSGGGPG